VQVEVYKQERHLIVDGNIGQVMNPLRKSKSTHTLSLLTSSEEEGMACLEIVKFSWKNEYISLIWCLRPF